MFYKNISVIEIENSTLCNARCPQCLREEIGIDSGVFDQEYLSTDFFETKIPDNIYAGLHRIHFAGTLGDPCAAPNFLDVIDVVKKKNPNIKITISTNGGLKTESWWKSLAEKLSSDDKVMFAIDGLEDTNHIYRVNVSWNNLIKNVKAFIAAGGTASWQYIVFRLNEHQREQAKEFAKELGFKEFLLKKTHRFAVSEIKGIKIVGSNNVAIEPSTDPEFVSDPLPSFTPDTWRKDSEHLKINCDALIESSCYIDVKGRLFPCCYVASAIYQYETDFGKLTNQGWKELWHGHGDNFINLHNYNWNEIIEGSFYNEIKRKWADTDRLSVCVAFCGANAKSPWPDVTEFEGDQSP